MFQIDEELKKLPAKPGVYLMHDKDDAIIYVGKALNLKNRVSQYFRTSRNVTPKIEHMIQNIDYFEYIITDSEMEALVLECNLIKEHNPKYNTKLKDGKAYPFIRATIQEEFPRLLFARQQKKDKAKYFGPYTSAEAVRDTMELIRKLYQIRACNRNLPKDVGKERPCLYYHIGQCKAPCQGYIGKEEYQKAFLEAVDFLNGNYVKTLETLEKKMLEASERLCFEEAAGYRDLINSVKHISVKQKANIRRVEDKDVVAMARTEEEAVVQVFFIRDGKMIGREHHYVTEVGQEGNGEVLEAFLKQFYSGTPYIPSEIILQEAVPDEELIRKWLSSKRGHNVYLRVPQKGEKEKLVELAEKNASLILKQDTEKLKKEERKTVGALKQIAQLLQLPELSRIESYDISNINGFQAVGSMVVFEGGKPKKSDYRKFKIRGVSGPDDYASMKEVLTRRFVHGLKEQKEMEEKGLGEKYGSFNRLPDLILMDGGKGQVGVAEKVLEELQLSIAVCGMVKDDKHRTRGLYYSNQEVALNRHDEGFKLITRIQDETHRFAIEYHRSLRGKEQVHSILDDIPSIGKARRKELMKHFPSIDAVKNASMEELASLPSMNRQSAERVFEYFHKESF